MRVSPSRTQNQLVLTSIVLFVLKCGSQIYAQDNDFAMPPSSNEIDSEIRTMADYGPNELLTEEKIEEFSNILAKLLLIPWPKDATPILYVERPYINREDLRNEAFDEMGINDNEDTMRPVSPKRSKYYRKYPWKRQQNSRYEPSYMCSPKKDDVYRLLVALHGERNGKRGQLVDFCNRKRPASLVFTNIRFVG